MRPYFNRNKEVDVDVVMNDITDALNLALKEGCDGDIVEDAIAKVKALVVPVISEQQGIISELEDTNEGYQEDLEELSREVDELKEESLDRKHEQERQELIKLFNVAAKGMAVYY